MQGDMVLERVADVVREATRLIDVAARYGGDELALILVETGREGATILGERLGERMRATTVPLRDGGSMGVTISVGVATIPDSAERPRIAHRRGRPGPAQGEEGGKEPAPHGSRDAPRDRQQRRPSQARPALPSLGPEDWAQTAVNWSLGCTFQARAQLSHGGPQRLSFDPSRRSDRAPWAYSTTRFANTSI